MPIWVTDGIMVDAFTCMYADHIFIPESEKNLQIMLDRCVMFETKMDLVFLIFII